MAGLSGVAPLFVLLATASARVAHASPAVVVTWEGTSHCRGLEDLGTRLPGTGGDSSPPVRVHARATQLADNRWQLELMLRNGALQAERRLTAESCAALVDAATAILSLVTAEWSAPEPPAPATPPPAQWKPPLPPTMDSTMDIAAAATSSRAEAFRGYFLAVGGVTDARTMIEPASGLSAAAGVQTGSVRLDATGMYLPGINTRDLNGLSLVAAGLGACVLMPVGHLFGPRAGAAVQLAPCGGVEGARLQWTGPTVPAGGSGTAPVAPPARSTLSLTATVGIEARVPARTRVGLRIAALAVAPLIPARFTIDNRAVPQAALSGRVGLAVEVRFP